MELRDEKQRLKAQKEKLEQQLTFVSTQPGFLQPPPSMAALFAPQHLPAGSKFFPIVSYPGVAMWQFMLPAAIDTSHDHVLTHLLPNSSIHCPVDMEDPCFALIRIH